MKENYVGSFWDTWVFSWASITCTCTCSLPVREGCIWAHIYMYMHQPHPHRHTQMRVDTQAATTYAAGFFLPRSLRASASTGDDFLCPLGRLEGTCGLPREDLSSTPTHKGAVERSDGARPGQSSAATAPSIPGDPRPELRSNSSQNTNVVQAPLLLPCPPPAPGPRAAGLQE